MLNMHGTDTALTPKELSDTVLTPKELSDTVLLPKGLFLIQYLLRKNCF
jgi:hypothetical protein